MYLSTNKRCIISCILTLPLLLEMILMSVLGWESQYQKFTDMFLSTLVMLLSARTFWISAWNAFKKHHANMDTLISIGTITTYLYSIYSMTVNKPTYFESSAIIISFILLGQVIEEHMKYQTMNSTEELLKIQAKDAEIWRNGKYKKLPLNEIKISDYIKVRPGEKIPTDGIIVNGHSNIDESLITGESLPVGKNINDKVIGATLNINGSFIMKVTKNKNETMLHQITNVVKNIQTNQTPIQKIVDKISNIFVPIVLIISIITFLIWYILIQVSFGKSLIYAINVILITCPCSLSLAIPTALITGSNVSAKRGILIKNGDFLNIITKIKTIAFDKTGTITKGQPFITNIIGSDKEKILQLAASLENFSEHPFAKAIVNKSQLMKIDILTVTDFKTLEGKGVQGRISNKIITLGNNKLFTSNTKITNELNIQANKLESDANTVIYLLVDQIIIGLIAIKDIPKDGSMKSISMLKKQGIKTIMLTGDNKYVSTIISHNVGINTVISNISPTEKAKEINKLKKTGIVAFVGDGINDAPALMTADLGISMGSGSDIAISAGDIILVKNNLQDVNLAIEISKKIFHKIKINLFWAFFYNIVGIPIAAGAFAFYGLILTPELASLVMAFSSISIVFNSWLLNFIKIK